uniref:Transmembrane protein 272 n=2 Tax=Equus TaxID=9789 RepID=A0A3Q2KQ53_HORSE
MPGGLEKACHQCISKIASNFSDVCTFHNKFLSLCFSPTFRPLSSPYFAALPSDPSLSITIQVSLLLYDSTRMKWLLSNSVVIDDDDDGTYPWRQNVHKCYIYIILSFLLFLWFILGNYWVFSVYLPDFIPPFQQPQDYREKTLYLFAVGVLVLSHSVLLLLVPCSGCVYVWSRRRSAVDEDRTTTSSTHAHAHAHRYACT